MMKRWFQLLHREEGVAMLVVLSFMALSIPILTAILSLAGTVSIDSRVKTSILKDQYATQGCTQHARYRLFKEMGYADTLIVGIPNEYSFNGCTITRS